ncbi:FliH/SctL family protein [Hutsoniella sourekii]|uniref:hypothetical protein n=1 Tax=Hutsoniella sourekii TaxID=87650 RepID=UPI00048500F0|nr:hypothetical protein [Hutsoniella sourekii]
MITQEEYRQANLKSFLVDMELRIKESHEQGLEQGLAQGLTQGLSEGLALGQARSYQHLLQKGLTPSQIADLYDVTESEVSSSLSLLSQSTLKN